MKGTVFSIEEFSIYDGPGIRTSVFLKECPLRCTWCHNPEGQLSRPEVVRSPNGCLHCGACEKGAVREGSRLVLQPDIIKKCPMHLLRICGEAWEAGALCDRVLQNKPLLVGGGVTFSGGEPFAQFPFLMDCLLRLRGRLHTAIQTCGYCAPADFKEALSAADYVLFDLKLADESQHAAHTGVSNRKILENFAVLADSGKEFTARVPLIPGVTDTEENITGIARILRENNVSYVEMLSYNKMAGAKYEMVGRRYEPDFDGSVPVNMHEEIFSSFGITSRLIK